MWLLKRRFFHIRNENNIYVTSSFDIAVEQIDCDLSVHRLALCCRHCRTRQGTINAKRTHNDSWENEFILSRFFYSLPDRFSAFFLLFFDAFSLFFSFAVVFVCMFVCWSRYGDSCLRDLAATYEDGRSVYIVFIGYAEVIVFYKIKMHRKNRRKLKWKPPHGQIFATHWTNHRMPWRMVNKKNLLEETCWMTNATRGSS